MKQQSMPVSPAAANNSQGNKALCGEEKSSTSDPRHTTCINPVLDGMFSVSTAVTTFMQGQGIKVTKQSLDYVADPTHKPHIVQSPKVTNSSKPSGDALESSTEPRVISTPKVPTLPSPLPKTTIILSSVLFSTQRTLIIEIKHLYADLS